MNTYKLEKDDSGRNALIGSFEYEQIGADLKKKHIQQQRIGSIQAEFDPQKIERVDMTLYFYKGKVNNMKLYCISDKGMIRTVEIPRKNYSYLKKKKEVRFKSSP